MATLGVTSPVNDRHFNMGVGIGDNTEPGHLTAVPAVCIYSTRGVSAWLIYHPFIITDISPITGDDADSFGAVMGASSPERHYYIAIILLQNFTPS
jgi:hypothetical protein